MKLIAKKPCSFGGMKFYIGDEIPEAIVLKPQEQEKLGVLSIMDDAQPDGSAEVKHVIKYTELPVVPVQIGDQSLNVTAEGLQAVFTVLAGKANDAAPVIKEMTDNDALILLHMVDSRNSVKSAAEARGKALEEAGEQ